MSIPAACATKIVAKDRYKVVPSKLKLNPVGNTNETISLDTPNFSIFSIALGNAASELAVPKAIETGCEQYFQNLIIEIFAIKAKGKKTNNTK